MGRCTDLVDGLSPINPAQDLAAGLLWGSVCWAVVRIWPQGDCEGHPIRLSRGSGCWAVKESVGRALSCCLC
eukprot:366462-Chlamydomonas_euryale.AAC.4